MNWVGGKDNERRFVAYYLDFVASRTQIQKKDALGRLSS